MERYSTTEIIKLLQEKDLSFFTLADFGRLFKVDKLGTTYKKIQRLEKKGIVKKLIKGKYLFVLNQPNDFLIANFLCPPSYISLESALSFYGLITGFPYQITSITTKKSKSFLIDEKEFRYSQININLFWGFEKKEDFLIAKKEKAFFDFLYFASKGLRKIDVDDLDFTSINKKTLKEYLARGANQKMLKLAKELKI